MNPTSGEEQRELEEGGSLGAGVFKIPRPEGRYMGLVNHALAKGEVSVWEVGQGLQQDLGSDGALEEGGVELVPVGGKGCVCVCVC